MEERITLKEARERSIKYLEEYQAKWNEYLRKEGEELFKD